MSLKLLFAACWLVVLVNCQTASFCNETSFIFYNGAGSTEVKWDWDVEAFMDGNKNAFDGFLYTLAGRASNWYVPRPERLNYYCDVGTTDLASASYTSYLVNVSTGTNMQLFREFYAPRSASWIRVVDSLINLGTDDLRGTIVYAGEYGFENMTTFDVLNEYYWIASNGLNDSSDTVVSFNAAGANASVIPVPYYDFTNGDENIQFQYYRIMIPPGESRSVLSIIGQHTTLAEATELAEAIHDMSIDIFVNMSSEARSKVVNWDLCATFLSVVNPQERFCSPSVTFQSSSKASFTLNGQQVAQNTQQFTANVTNGINQLTYQLPSCDQRTRTFNLKVPPTELTLVIDASGKNATATGGYGGYQYSFSEPLNSKITVTVTDAEGCVATTEIAVPLSPQETNKINLGSRTNWEQLAAFVCVLSLLW